MYPQRSGPVIAAFTGPTWGLSTVSPAGAARPRRPARRAPGVRLRLARTACQVGTLSRRAATPPRPQQPPRPPGGVARTCVAIGCRRRPGQDGLPPQVTFDVAAKFPVTHSDGCGLSPALSSRSSRGRPPASGKGASDRSLGLPPRWSLNRLAPTTACSAAASPFSYQPLDFGEPASRSRAFQSALFRSRSYSSTPSE